MIDAYLTKYGDEIGIDFSEAKDGSGWTFMAGSARIHVIYDADAAMLTVDSTILSLPEPFPQETELLRRLLELNHRSTGEARFALVGRDVLVTFTRPTLGLDYEEFRSGITSVCQTADDYDDELHSQFLEALEAEAGEIALGDEDEIE